jgi:CheY-like chemotaxis protein
MNTMSDLKTILIVDDEPVNADVLVAIFKDKYKVKVATSGEKALKIANKSIPDIVLLDVVMPVMDGHETCRQLLKLSSDIPIILVTGNSSDEDVVKGKEVGAKDLLAKPVDPDAVIKAVEDYI